MAITTPPPPASSLPFFADVPARTDFDTDRLAAGFAAMTGDATSEAAATAARYLLTIIILPDAKWDLLETNVNRKTLNDRTRLNFR